MSWPRNAADLFRSTSLLAVAMLASLGLLAQTSSACPYSIRDSAFIRGDGPEVFRLIFIGTGDRDQLSQLADWIGSTAEAWLGDANVVAEAVSPRSQEVLRLQEQGKLEKTAHGELPAAVLVSPQGEVMRVKDIPHSAMTMDTVMDIIVRSIDSPARRKLLDQVARAWCVVLMTPGSDEAENDRVRKDFQAAARRIEGTTTEMDKAVTARPVLIEVDADDAGEAVLLWSAGLQREMPRDPATEKRAARVAMIVGRGQQRGPVLVGDEIDEKRLFEMFQMLGRNCTCTTDAMWITGRSLPIQWDAEMDQVAQIELGFDPSDPEALDVLRNSVSGAAGGGLAGYREVMFGAASIVPSGSSESADSPSAEIPAPQTVQSPTTSDRPATTKNRETPSTIDGTSPRAFDSETASETTRSGFPLLGGIIASAVVLLSVATVVILRQRAAV